MSSSQQHSTNSNNNNQIPPINPQYQQYSDYHYNEYEIDDPLAGLNNSYYPAQAQFQTGYGYPAQPYSSQFMHPYVEPDNNLPENEEDFSRFLEEQFEDNDESGYNEHLHDNNDDEIIYSDDVQNAFENYEKEFSKQWKHTDSHDEMYEQMRECMRFMSEDYSTDETPAIITEPDPTKSDLNPDALEFKPSWLPATPKDEETSASKSSNSADEQKEKEKQQNS